MVNVNMFKTNKAIEKSYRYLKLVYNSAKLSPFNRTCNSHSLGDLHALHAYILDTSN